MVGVALALIASHRWSVLTLHLDGSVAWTRSHQLGYFVGAIGHTRSDFGGRLLRVRSPRIAQRERDGVPHFRQLAAHFSSEQRCRRASSRGCVSCVVRVSLSACSHQPVNQQRSQDHSSFYDLLVEGGDVEQVHPVVQHSDDRGAQETPDDAAPPAGERGPAHHRRRDRVQLEAASSRWLM